jgi:hypothetical protein
VIIILLFRRNFSNNCYNNSNWQTIIMAITPIRNQMTVPHQVIIFR